MMSYYEEWQKKTDENADANIREAFIKNYYAEEREAYDRILTAFPDTLSGTAKDLRDRLGFTDPVVFAGFVDGLNPSLATPVPLETMDDASILDFVIDYESLFWNMHEAKADWLYELDSWDGVLAVEKRDDIVKRFRTSKMAVSSKVGRNDPCPCGSGRKYKVCCGKS
jgi:hypothetical protein